MGLYLIICYLVILITGMFVSMAVNHKIIKRFTKQVIHNDCYYLDPVNHKWNLKMAQKYLQEERKSKKQLREEQKEMAKIMDESNDISKIKFIHLANMSKLN